MIAAGMWVQAGAIVWIGSGHRVPELVAAAALLGLGTARVYPTLLAAVSDVAHPSWRASAVGVYRLWRDGGYAAGAVTAGLLADAVGIAGAFGMIAGLTALSGIVVAAIMEETLSRPAGRDQRTR
jgi:MFS family permease